jgi:hypothetical protein
MVASFRLIRLLCVRFPAPSQAFVKSAVAPRQRANVTLVAMRHFALEQKPFFAIEVRSFDKPDNISEP